MDELDRRILNLLKADSSVPFKEIARELDVSTSSVARRISRLREENVLRFTIEIDQTRLGLKAVCFSLLSLRKDSRSKLLEIVQSLEIFSEIEEIYSVFGDSDLLIKIRIERNSDLPDLYNKIIKAANIERIQTLHVVDTHKK